MEFEDDIRSEDQQQVDQMWATEAGVDYTPETKAEGSEEKVDPEAGEHAGTEKADEPETKVDGETTEVVDVDFTPPAWLQLVPEEAREQAEKDFKASRSNVKANAVRVQQLTRHLNSARQQLEQAERAQSQAPKFVLPADATLDEVKKDFPDLAEWLEKSIQSLAQQTAQHNQSVLNPLRQAVEVQTNALAETVQTANDEDYQAARNEVLRVVPDAAVISKSEGFQSWLTHQSPGIQNLIRSREPSDNITLFTLYKGTLPKAADRLKDHAELPKKGGQVIQTSDDDVQDPLTFWQREFQKPKT